jgi:hypothetical protein
MFPTALMDVPVNSYHPNECRFCEWTDSEITAALADFNEWAGIKTTKYPPEVEAFLMLSAEEQARLVAKQRQVRDQW